MKGRADRKEALNTQNSLLTSEKMQSIELNAWFGAKQALKNINLSIRANSVTAIIGPSAENQRSFGASTECMS
jgi:ABC-type phosphate transport system ATPase subunit